MAKYEAVRIIDYETGADAEASLGHYFSFYYDGENIARRTARQRPITNIRAGQLHLLVASLTLDDNRDIHLKSTSYQRFSARESRHKDDPAPFLSTLKVRKKTIVACGASAKGNCLPNHCVLDYGIVDCVVDDTPGNRGNFFPSNWYLS